MKILTIIDGKEYGYKKPILCVDEGNTRTKIASFNSEEAVELFIDWAKEICIVHEECTQEEG